MSDMLQPKSTIKGQFLTGMVPTQDNFNNWITTMVAEGGNTGSIAHAIQTNNASATGINGAIAVGNGAIASGNNGSCAIGLNAVASNTGSVQFSTGTNNVEYSLRVKNSPRLCGNGIPVSPANGDIWIDSGYVYIRANNYSSTIGSPKTVVLGNVASNVSTNVINGDIFEMYLINNITLDKPTNGIDGKSVTWMLTQSNGGSRSITLDGSFVIPTSATLPLAWSTNVGSTDLFAAKYNASHDKWLVISMVPGYIL